MLSLMIVVVFLCFDIYLHSHLVKKGSVELHCSIIVESLVVVDGDVYVLFVCLFACLFALACLLVFLVVFHCCC